MNTVKVPFLKVQNRQVANNNHLVMQNEWPYLIGRFIGMGGNGSLVQKMRGVMEMVHGEGWQIAYDPRYRAVITLYGSLEEIDDSNFTDNDRQKTHDTLQRMLDFYLTQVPDSMLRGLESDKQIDMDRLEADYWNNHQK